jgi:hypothetical protein
MTNEREGLTLQTQDFIRSLALGCKTEEEWLILMRLGIDELSQDQRLLMTLIVDRAVRDAQPDFTIHVGTEVNRLMALLSVRVIPVRD